MICSINVRDKVLPVLMELKRLVEAEGLDDLEWCFRCD